MLSKCVVVEFGNIFIVCRKYYIYLKLFIVKNDEKVCEKLINWVCLLYSEDCM